MNQTPTLPSATKLPRNVRILGWASFLNDVASEMIFPLMPQFLLAVLGGSRFQLGIIEGVADSTSSFVKLWSGGMSDRAAGRKRFVVFGYAVAALARPLIGIITMPWQLFTIRIADRLGKGVRTSPRDALIADSTDAAIRGRAFGFHRGMDHLGAALGPVLAAGFLWAWPDAFTEPAEKTLVANLVGGEERGLAYGWYNFAVGIGTLPASLIFGGLYQACGALAAFGFGAAMALFANDVGGSASESALPRPQPMNPMPRR